MTTPEKQNPPQDVAKKLELVDKLRKVLTDEEINVLHAKLNGELSDDELDKVSGGISGTAAFGRGLHRACW